eukprot:TRINITY_DN1443_c0_g1_i5.p1 TRINITY_DN1443_c0_g1~~TRINITY_DN1443_c0_g1_i5.p1  ORF type:complete len:200 (-),score=1.64 TRINITY_DN1443_c0_g1_i5:192-791(-)
MIVKIIILITVLIAGISMLTASPVAGAGEEEYSDYTEPMEPVEMNLTGTEFQGNESGLNISVFSQSSPSYRLGYLTVTMKYARGLRDTDGWFNLPDPYAVVYAHYSDCGVDRSIRDETHYVQGTTYPSWYKVMTFGWGNWINFNFQIWDKDTSWDDAMTDVYVVTISPGVHCYQVYYSSGSVTYDYYFQTSSEVCYASC